MNRPSKYPNVSSTPRLLILITSSGSETMPLISAAVKWNRRGVCCSSTLFLPPPSSLCLNVLSLTALMRRNDTGERDGVCLCVYTCGSKLRPCGLEKVTGSRWAGRKPGGGSALSTADAAAATLRALSLKAWTVEGRNYLLPAAELYLLRLRNEI